MSRLAKILIGLGVAIVVLAGLAVGGWYFFIKSDPKPPAEITKTTTVGGGTLDGTYRVAPGDADPDLRPRSTRQCHQGSRPRIEPLPRSEVRAHGADRGAEAAHGGRDRQDNGER